MSQTDLAAMQSLSQTFGQSLVEPFFFMQQVFNTLQTLYQDSVGAFSSVTVTVYVGSGHHYLFGCADGFNADFSSLTSLTDFCRKIKTLKTVYSSLDTIQLSIQPLYCNLTLSLTQDEQSIFTSNCVSSVRPVLHAVDAYFQFNVTNSITIQSLDFEASSMQALYKDQPNQGMPVREIPVQLCTFDPVSSKFQASVLPFSFECKQLPVVLECQSFKNERCLGDPYSLGYFDIYGGVANGRRQSLFNLYAFDRLHSQQPKTPSLVIDSCTFSNFLSNTQSLINVETINVWGSSGYFTQLGADNGAQITIRESSFLNMIFCKGLIVYRQGTDLSLQNVALVNNNAGVDGECDGCQILIQRSNFVNLNYKTQLTTFRPQIKSNDSRISFRFDPSGAIATPLFQNYGAFLNLEDFPGPIELSECTVSQSFVSIPGIQFGLHSSSTLPQNQLSYFYNAAENHYQTCVNQNQLLVDGIREMDPLDLNSLLEHHSIIYISRPQQPVILIGNTFDQNIGGMFGVLSINSPQSFIILENNIWRQCTSYLSGSAVFIRFTRNAASQICGQVTIQNDSYLANFGTKVSSGTLSLVCDLITDPKDYDFDSYFQAQPLATITDLSSTKTFTVTNTVVIKNVNFDGNLGGQKGTAIFLKAITAVQVSSSTIQNNKAVDAYQELSLLPPYTKYVIGLDSNGKPNRLMSFKALCGGLEFTYLETCQTNGFEVDQTKTQGAIYYEGSGCGEAACPDEFFQLSFVIFKDNRAGLPLPNVADQAQSLYLKNSKSTSISDCQFLNHADSYAQVIQAKASILYQNTPANYFDSAHAPIIRAKQTPGNQLDLSRNTFSGNKHFQTLTAPINQTIIQLEASLLVVTATILSSVKLEANTITSNYVIGDSGLFIFKNVANLTLNQNQVSFNGALTLKNYTSTTTTINFSKMNPISLSQTFGIFIIENCPAVVAYLNAFKYNAAQYGVAFTVRQSSVYYSQNVYSNHIAVSGSIASITGSGAFLSSSQNEIVETMIGTAFAIKITDDLHLSKFSFQNLQVFDTVSEDVGVFNLDSVGAFACFNCVFQSDVSSGTDQISRFITDSQVLDQEYMNSRLMTLNTQASVVFATNSYHLGTTNNFNLNGINFQVEALTRVHFMWFKECSVKGQIGGLAGIYYLQNSKLYVSNIDGYNGRLLGFSSYLTQYNRGSQGGGVVTAVQNSSVVLKGCNFQFNTGYDGGIAKIIDSKIEILSVYASFNTAQNQGGFLNSYNSYYSIDASTILNGQAYQAAFVFQTGVLLSQQVSFIGNVLVQDSNSHSNIVEIAHGNLTFYQTKFTDNNSKAGSNAIYATSSVIIAIQISVTQSTQLRGSEVTNDSGFIVLLQSSTLTLNNSKLQGCQGILAGVIYSQGSSQVTINRVDVNESMTTSSSGGIINIQNCLPTNIIGLTMSQNLGAPSLTVVGGDLVLSKSTLSQTTQTLLYAVKASLTITSSTFENAGSYNHLGGAIYCECYSSQIVSNTFQNLFSASGAGFYLIGLPLSSIQFQQNQFRQDAAQLGGAITIITADTVDISSNLFLLNTARVISPQSVALATLPSQRGQGGGIFMLCLQAYNQPCNVTIRRNTFDSNVAQDDGGAIMFLNQEPILLPDQPNIFTQNQASNQTNNITDISQFIPHLQIITQSNNDPLQKTNLTLDTFNVVSGVPIDVSIGIFDQSNRPFLSSITASAKFRVNAKEKSIQVYLNGNIVAAEGSIFNFTGLKITTQPKSQFTLELVATLGQNSTINLIIQVLVRQCLSGEQFTIDERCSVCPASTYSMGEKTEVSECEICLENAVCFGGDKIVPKNGYYKTTPLAIVKCLNHDACLEGTVLNDYGICSLGYHGKLCSKCDDGYYQHGASHLCDQCPYENVATTAICLIIFLPIFLCSVITFIIWIGVSFAKYPESFLPALVKILVVHFQQVFIFRNFQQSSIRGTVVIEYLVLMQSFVQIQVERFVRCYLGMESADWIIYQRYIWFFTPIYVVIITLILTLGLAFALKIPKIIPQLSFQTFYVACAITSLPELYHILTSFNCSPPDYYLAEDRERFCFQGDYVTFIAKASVAFTAWCVAVPTSNLISMCKRRQDIQCLINCGWSTKDLNQEELLMLQQTQLMFGVQINGLKASFYFWDVVTLLRNGGVCAVFVGMNLLGQPQELIMLWIVLHLVFFAILEQWLSPYKDPQLNKIQAASTFSIACLYLTEMAIASASHYQIDVSITATVIAVFFGVLPHVFFFYLMLKNLRFYVLQYAYWRSVRLFKILTCGLVQETMFIKNKEKTEVELEFNSQSIEKLGTDQFSQDEILKPEQVVCEMATQRKQIQNSCAKLLLSTEPTPLAEELVNEIFEFNSGQPLQRKNLEFFKSEARGVKNKLSIDSIRESKLRSSILHVLKANDSSVIEQPEESSQSVLQSYQRQSQHYRASSYQASSVVTVNRENVDASDFDQITVQEGDLTCTENIVSAKKPGHQKTIQTNTPRKLTLKKLARKKEDPENVDHGLSGHKIEPIRGQLKKEEMPETSRVIKVTSKNNTGAFSQLKLVDMIRDSINKSHSRPRFASADSNHAENIGSSPVKSSQGENIDTSPGKPSAVLENIMEDRRATSKRRI